MSMDPPPPFAGANAGGTWPPSPTSFIDDDRSRLRSLLSRYRSIAGLARWVVGFQFIVIILEIMMVMELGATPGPSGYGSSIATISLLPTCIQELLFLIWTCRLYQNTVSLGVQGLRSTPGFAVAYFFIPILGFYKPYQIFREVWLATAPEIEQASSDGNRRRTHATPLLLFWWLGYLFVNISTFIIVGAASSGIDGFTSAISDLCAIGVQVLGVLVVRGFTHRQEARYAETAARLAN